MEGDRITSPLIIALDVSGSTANYDTWQRNARSNEGADARGMVDRGENAAYWRRVRALLATLPDDGNTRVVLWGGSAHEVTLAEARALAAAPRVLRDGTSPRVVARWLVSNQSAPYRLVLVTDGNVSGSEVEATDAALTAAHTPLLTHVEAHIVPTGYPADRSVTAPFTRSCPHVVYEWPPPRGVDYRPTTITAAAATGELPDKEVLQAVDAATLAALDGLETIATLEAFEAAYPALQAAVEARLMGSSAYTTAARGLRERILALGRALSKALAARDAEQGVALTAALAAGDAAAEAAAATLYTAYHAPVGTSGTDAGRALQSKLSWLLRVTEGALERTFKPDEIAAQRGRTAPHAALVTAYAAGVRGADTSGDAAAYEGRVAGLGDAAAGAVDAAVAAWTCPLTYGSVADGELPLVLPLVKRRTQVVQSKVMVPEYDDGYGSDGSYGSGSEGGASPRMAERTVERTVVVLDGAAPLLATVARDKPVIDALLDCPLAVTRGGADFRAVAEALLDRLAPPLSRDGAAAWFAHAAARGPIEHPITRETLYPAALVLGANAEHAAATDSALFCVLSGGRVVGSPDLWYGALVYLIEEGLARGERPWLAAAVPALRAQLAWRAAHRTSRASLSGLPTLVSTRVPLGVALWYVSQGAAATADAARARQGAPPPEAIRAHLPHAAAVDWLLDAATPSTWPRSARGQAHRALLRVALAMLALKKDAPEGVGGKLWAEAVDAAVHALRAPSVPVNVTAVGADVQARAGIRAFLPLDYAGGSRAAAANAADDAAAWLRDRSRGLQATWATWDADVDGLVTRLARGTLLAVAADADGDTPDDGRVLTWLDAVLYAHALTKANDAAGDVRVSLTDAGGHAAAHGPRATARAKKAAFWPAWTLPPADGKAPTSYTDVRVVDCLAAVRGVRISLGTARPLYVVDGAPWHATAHSALQSSDAWNGDACTFSTTKMYMDFVVKYRRWPASFDEWATYVAAKLRRGDKAAAHGPAAEALPQVILATWIQEHALHAPLRAAMTAVEAANKYKATRVVGDRVAAERASPLAEQDEAALTAALVLAWADVRDGGRGAAPRAAAAE